VTTATWALAQQKSILLPMLTRLGSIGFSQRCRLVGIRSRLQVFLRTPQPDIAIDGDTVGMAATQLCRHRCTSEARRDRRMIRHIFTVQQNDWRFVSVRTSIS
jgi:hypothetical protein